MNQLSCLFVEDRDSIKDLCRQQESLILHFSNKARSFVFILHDHYSSWNEFESKVHADSVLPLNEVLTQFLTHSTKTNQSISHPVILEKPTLYWIQDIDNFIGFPKEVEKKIFSSSPHMFFYENLDYLSKKK